MHAQARRLHALPQRLVLRFELRSGASPSPSPSCPRRPAFRPAFGLEGPRAPGRQLFRALVEDRLQLVQRLRVNSLAVEPQARPPEPAARPSPTDRLPPARVSGPDRGRSSATPRSASPPGPFHPDIRRTPRGDRAAGPPPGETARRPLRPSRRRAGPGRRPAPPAASRATPEIVPAPAARCQTRCALQTRTADRPIAARPHRACPPTPRPPPRPPPPIPSPSQQLAGRLPGTPPRPLTQSGA